MDYKTGSNKNFIANVLISNSANLGPFVYENWCAALEGNALVSAYEYPLFTDANITGQIREGYGTYQLLNPITRPKALLTVPRIILRLDYYLQKDMSTESMKKTDTSRYHGGSISDEVAALVSLDLGIRLKAGPETRWFRKDEDERGRPLFIDTNQNPILLQTREGAILPRAKGKYNLEISSLIARLTELTEEDANALVRTARLYQDGIWIAESEPEIAWLMLVSAVETAADHWRKAKESAVERLWASKEKLANLLQEEVGDNLVEKAADILDGQLGATKKFRDFVLEFLSDPPSGRPAKHIQHPWDRKSIKRSMTRIYDLRSRALHDGTPFPLPMCTPPFKLNKIPAEVPVGSATRAKGGTWVKEDTPMYLHTFEYIVRGTLHNWVEYMLNED